MRKRERSVTVEGWTFTGEDGGAYVDITPKGCLTAIDAIWVAGEGVQDADWLRDLGRAWLVENRPNLAGYIEQSRWYDAAR